jgi:hypothetical protein
LHPSITLGEMPEWSIGAVSKTVVPSRVPRVRIPVSPPIRNAKKSKPLKINTFQWFFVCGKCRKKQKKAGFELEDRWKEW